MTVTTFSPDYTATQRRVREFFGTFSHVSDIYGHLNRILAQGGRDVDPECLALLGDTGVGKTKLLKRFVQDHPRVISENGTTVPVFYVEVPAKCTIKSIAGHMLRLLGSPFADKGDEPERTFQLVTLLKNCGVKLIILDEVNHLTDRGSRKTHYHVGDWIKQVISASGVPMVLSGTERIELLLETNEQLGSRFSERIYLAPLSLERASQTQITSILRTYRSLLGDMAGWDFTAEPDSRLMVLATGARLRSVSRLLCAAIRIAERQKATKITQSILGSAFIESIFPKATPKRNPFHASFSGMALIESGEPFHVLDHE